MTKAANLRGFSSCHSVFIFQYLQAGYYHPVSCIRIKYSL